MNEKPLTTEEAMERAKGLAEKAGLPMVFLTITDVKKEKDVYIVKIQAISKEYEAHINAQTGDAIEWRQI
jgi:uncharacterized membrane protein YkoI